MNHTFQIPDDRHKVTVWAGLCGDGRIIGPYFFEGNVNGQAYLQMIDDFVIPELVANYGVQLNGAFRRFWWYQDGAPAHRLGLVRDTLQGHFPNRFVGIGHEIEWPPRSPDLTPCDFFLWGYVKSKVYTSPPGTLDELRNRITAAFQEVPRDMVARAVGSMRRRAAICVGNNGFHVEGRFMEG